MYTPTSACLGRRVTEVTLPCLLALLYVSGDLSEILNQSQVVLQPGYLGSRVGLHLHHELSDLMQVDSFQLAKGGLDRNKAFLCASKRAR